DRPARLRDHMLDDREAEARPAGRPCPIRPKEALEKARKLGLLDADAVVARREHDGAVGPALDGQRERGARPGVAEGVLGQVPRDHAQHAGANREMDRRIALEPKVDAGPHRAVLELVERLLENGADGLGAERDDPRARLELAQEEHLVDQLGDLVDLCRGPFDELGHVFTRQRRGLEESEEPREWCSKLVRDGRGEPGPELLGGGEVPLAREVDEPLGAPVDVVWNDQRNDPALAAQEIAGQRLALSDALDGLTRAATRENDAVEGVEDDDGLAALLDERAPAYRVVVHAFQRF